MTRTLVTLLLVAALAAGCASAPAGEPTYRFDVRHDLGYAEGGAGAAGSNESTEAQRMDLYVPRGAGPFPAVVVIHGGSWRTGRRWEMDRVAEALATAGFVVANIDYRLAPEFHHPAQYDDATAAVRWLRAHASEAKVDPTRIGAWGYSAGAHLALLLATRPAGTDADGSTRIQAVVGGGTPADLLAFGDNALVTTFMGGPASAMRDAYRDASPITHVSAGDPPAFLYHGTDDWIVDPAQTAALADALRKVGVPVTVESPRGGHIYEFLFGYAEERDGVAFMRRTLQAGRSAPGATSGTAQ